MATDEYVSGCFAPQTFGLSVLFTCTQFLFIEKSLKSDGCNGWHDICLITFSKV